VWASVLAGDEVNVVTSSASASAAWPGRLAELTGLTTGAVTSVIDRLERAGFAQRVLDPSDRGKVIVKPDEAKVEQELLPRSASSTGQPPRRSTRSTTRTSWPRSETSSPD
jgi:hypothetical protein